MFWEAILKLGNEYLKEKKRMADATVDLTNAADKISNAVGAAVVEIKKLADIIAAGLPANGGGGVTVTVAEEVATRLNTLADGLGAAVASAEAPPVV